MSRLSENSIELRNKLSSRNLYTPTDPYNLETKKLVDVVNNLASVVQPFSTFDLTNTVIGRLTGPNTPIAQIGLIMLTNQFSKTLSSNAIREFMPDISFANLFDGNPSTKLLTTNIDFQITKRENRSKFSQLIEDLTGNYVPSSPFNQESTVYDYIRNTGSGQLQFFYDNINKNLYKQSDRYFRTLADDEGFSLRKVSDILYDKYYFSLSNPTLFSNPYTPSNAINLAEIQVREELADNIDEYSTSKEFIDLLGKSDLRETIDPNSRDESLNSQNYGHNDNQANQIYWGDYGKNIFTNDKRFGVEENTEVIFNSNLEIFNAKKGLLKYTAELLNATESKLIDQTRKKFFDPNNQDKFVGFNGGGLYYPPEDSLFADKDGIRQHTPFDPYNKYAKAIRFNGNQVYNSGNENSTIYKSVIPKFHPVLNGNDNTIDVKNLMFSIENLAVEVRKDDENNIAYIDDNYGTVLPMSEVGQLGGRLMWFPPYDIKLSEQAISRHETTTFIGRSEPIYTYNNSERLATLSFKMLMDYPEQLINKRGTSTFQEDAAKFFAFGGDTLSKTFNDIGILNKRLNELKQQKQELIGIEEINRPQLPTAPESYFHFMNDEPNEGSESTSVESTINRKYEDGNKATTTADGTDFGLNKEFYEDAGGLSDFQTKINDFFGDEETRGFLKITLVGSATKLYAGADAEEYNKALSERRIKAVKDYINDTFLNVVDNATKNLEDYGVVFLEQALGAVNSSDANSSVETISSESAKSERQVQIIFGVNSKSNFKENELTIDQQNDLKEINNEIEAINNQIKIQKREIAKYSTSLTNHLFDELKEDDLLQKGFMSIDRNKFNPIFHTQTPEDFHRRLTFLHQCTRQGKAVNNKNSVTTVSKNSVFGRQPIQVLRIGDFFHTKIVIDNINFEYSESTWDLNPEGLGVQPMIVDITMQMRVIGGQSLRTPINVLQNAVSFNYYANSTYKSNGLYNTPVVVEDEQMTINENENKLREEKDVKDITTRAYNNNVNSD